MIKNYKKEIIALALYMALGIAAVITFCFGLIPTTLLCLITFIPCATLILLEGLILLNEGNKMSIIMFVCSFIIYVCAIATSIIEVVL